MVMRRVSFRTLSPFLLRDAGRHRSRDLHSTCQADLYEPTKRESVQRPGLVIVEGLGGLKRSRERKYANMFVECGNVALVIDSFGSRGVSWLPDNLRGLIVTEAMLCADAFAGLHYLSQHPLVDPKRIFVLGFSYGGMIAAMTAYRQIRDLFATADERFAGHVSYYGCSIPRFDDLRTTGQPVLILLGERDANVDIARMRAIAEDMRRGGSPVELEILPNAFHQWDTNHTKKKRITFSLRGLKLRVTTDHRVLEEQTGREIRGALSRIVAIIRGMSTAGYHMLRNDFAARRSNQLLMSFLR
jgi:dienelactone hydrolase